MCCSTVYFPYVVFIPRLMSYFNFFFQKLINCNKWSGIQSVSTTFHLNKLFSFLHLPFIFAYFIKIPPKQMQAMIVCLFIRTKFVIQNIFFYSKILSNELHNRTISKLTTISSRTHLYINLLFHESILHVLLTH